MNVVILQGTLSRPPTARDLPSGDQMVAFEVTTRPAEGPAETVPVCWLDPPRRALRKGAWFLPLGHLQKTLLSCWPKSRTFGGRSAGLRLISS